MHALDPDKVPPVLATLISHAAQSMSYVPHSSTSAALHALVPAIQSWALHDSGSHTAATHCAGNAALVALRRALTELEADLLPQWDAAAFHMIPQPLGLQSHAYYPAPRAAWPFPL
jgi:hypothetical protein